MNEYIQLITDSGSGLSAKEAAALDVAVMPMDIHIGGKTYQEGIDISPEAYFALAEPMHDDIPRVTSPSVEKWQRLYNSFAGQVTHLLVVTQSSHLSNAFQMAEQATAYLTGKTQIVVVDSETISYNQQTLLRIVAQAIHEGQPFAEVVQILRGSIPHTYAEFFNDSLLYLQRHRRLGVAQAILGTMLEIKPLLLLDGGDFIPLEKILQWEDATPKLMGFIQEFTHVESVTVVQRGFDALTAELVALLKEEYLQEIEYPVASYNPSLAVHIGPQAFGVMVYEGLPKRGFI